MACTPFPAGVKLRRSLQVPYNGFGKCFAVRDLRRCGFQNDGAGSCAGHAGVVGRDVVDRLHSLAACVDDDGARDVTVEEGVEVERTVRFFSGVIVAARGPIIRIAETTLSLLPAPLDGEVPTPAQANQHAVRSQ
jgi:hypothetical protein